jgi:hypothetical protein
VTPRQRGPIPTSRLGLARALWCFGEDDLWPRVLALPLPVLADICRLAGQMSNPDTERQWGHRITKSSALALAAIAVLVGKSRYPARREARDRKHLPSRLRGADLNRENAELAQIRSLLGP